MYESYFGLHRRPFLAAPSASRYFAATHIEAARSTLARCVERAEGVGLLVGPSGTGKTILLQLLAEQFRGRYQPVLLAGGHLTTRRALLQVILFELGLPYRDREEGELRLTLIEHLARNDQELGSMLMLVDEAHVLPTRLLEEVRMITNLMRQGQPCVHLILAGGPALEHRLTSPKLDSLNQRLAARCYLEALDRSETREYVRHQLAACGGRSEAIFDDAAVEAIYRASGGIPRLINQIGDHALMLAYADGQLRLDAMTVERTWADLQQLPAPWVTGADAGTTVDSSNSETASAVIEFGSLEDEGDQSATDADELAPCPLIDKAVEADETAADIELRDWLAELVDHPMVAPDPSPVLLDPIDMAMPADPVWYRDAEPLVEMASPPGPLSPPTGQHPDDELVVDRYAALDARREQAALGQAPAESAVEPTDNAGEAETAPVGPTCPAEELYPDTQSPEELLTLAEALLFREMAGLDPMRPAEREVPGTIEEIEAAASPTAALECQDVSELSHVSPRANVDGPDTESMGHDTPESPSLGVSPRELAAGHSDSNLVPEDTRLRLVEAVAGVIPVSAGEGDFADRSDADLIVVDDDPPRMTITLASVTPPASTPQVRRPEYRQLFARLRRGENV